MKAQLSQFNITAHYTSQEDYNKYARYKHSTGYKQLLIDKEMTDT
jgi:hypothetical protein